MLKVVALILRQRISVVVDDRPYTLAVATKENLGAFGILPKFVRGIGSMVELECLRHECLRSEVVVLSKLRKSKQSGVSVSTLADKRVY